MSGTMIDPAHRAFAPFTDVTAMRGALVASVQSLWHAPVRIAGCELAHAWRKTYAQSASWRKSTLRVCYRLRLETAAGETFPAWVHGIARLSPEPVASGDGGATASIRQGDATLVLRRFPDDVALPQLARLLDAARTSADLRRLGVVTADAAVFPDGIEVCRYRPGERCALRVTVSGGAHSLPVRLFAKTFADDSGERVYRRLLEIAELGEATGGGPLVAAPVAYDRETRTLWQRWIDGREGAEALTSDTLTLDLARVIRSLADLHAASLSIEGRCDRRAFLDETRKRAQKLANAYPAAADALATVISRCEAALPVLPAAACVPIHGDAHLGQFLLQNGAVLMADLDELHRGEAAQDLASLLVDMRLRSDDGCGVSAWHRAAISAYACIRGAIPHPLLSWYLALQCLQKGYRLYWRGMPALDVAVLRAIDWAVDTAADLAPGEAAS